MVVTYRCNAGFLPPEHWTQDPLQGGGRLVGEACHFIDLANDLCGAAPVRVTTSAMDDAGRYRGDNFVVSLAYANGSIATITYVANGDKQSGKERIEAFSGGRTAVLDDFRVLELHEGGRVERVKTTTDKGHAGECVAWLEAIRTGAPSPIPLADIVATMKATFAARTSAGSGATVEVA